MIKLSPKLTMCALLALALGAFVAVHGQNREKFGISATAGGVNSVLGRVMLMRAGQATEQPLSAQDDLASGDRVTTSAGARAEVLLNPGSYFRIGENSVFELVDNSLDNLRVKLLKGSAILEATGGDDTELRINIITDQNPLVIVRRGIYRLNAKADGTELLVQKGRVALSSNPRDIAKGGSRITVTNATPQTAKLGKYQQDEFDNWSKERGENLARANDQLSARALNERLTDDWPWAAAFGGYGLWTFSSTMRCYTFLPFYYGWASPYGHYYGLYFGMYDYFPRGGDWRNRGGVIAGAPTGSGGSPTGSSGPTNPVGSSGSSPSVSPTMSAPPSQAGPRDPDSGGRSINRIKDPK